MRVPDGEIEAEALRYKKLQLEHISRFGPWYMGGVRIQGYGVICRFRREEQGRQPIRRT